MLAADGSENKLRIIMSFLDVGWLVFIGAP
jgi:hypothetical protein